jgi:hypothetical protein
VADVERAIKLVLGERAAAVEELAGRPGVVLQEAV